ncbi:hypothetical protein BC962_1184 [Gillisia mitskevichiae]|uniref:Septum formation inhibitor Maf n=1 Tax=Gillisia mitskevichiae TaxID=270921 RepID=A0A495PW31_9FLAO|nr:septum formation inhibitor Maf [Gillisia mitskevichiae]RKS52939.1 hypothetical protein BC962_1184 [Gillisia mitskevichiae]
MRTNYCLLFYGIFLLILLSGCKDASSSDVSLPERNLSKDFKSYWFNGEAEITSYKLDQSRYGESREGTAVLIFVTEEFLPEAQVKANAKTEKTIPILKLNATKKFNTGIYPYSIMQSTFYPLEGKSHALKVSASIQEWCGHVYIQLNNREKFEITSHSYFEGEADKEFELPKTYLENEVWTQLRINPDLLPTGDINMIPSLESLRMGHLETQPYKALAEFYQDGEWSVYKITYPELKRNLKIYYSNIAPFKIEKWQEETKVNGKLYTTTATKMKDLKSDYWNKKSNNDLHLRKELNLY